MSEEKKQPETTEQEGSMPFLGHLKELRNRIIYSMIAVVVSSGIAGAFHDVIIDDLILGPAELIGLELINLKVFGQPIFYFKIILTAGIIISIPVLLYQVWRFIKPALYEKEIKSMRGITLSSSFCFFGGVTFAYTIIIPGMLKFVNSFGTQDIANNIDINNYLSFLILIVVSMGILFEMPVATYLLAKAGLLSSKSLIKYWRHAIVVILVLAAVITPTPDPISQLIFATPLFLLYILSIFIAKAAERNAETEIVPLTEEIENEED
jgi:sec-independent protein translocase protein TatC